MKIDFPSHEFDDAVFAVCHDMASDEQLRALNELLRHTAAARDEYILRLELHSRLASEADLFASAEAENGPTVRRKEFPTKWALALAACLALIAAVLWMRRPSIPVDQAEPTSKAVAMLSRTADAQWPKDRAVPRLNAPLDPGPLRLEGGLAQIVFYSGARIIVEGPADLELLSEGEALFRRGRIVVDVPAQAHGFRVNTPHLSAIDLGTSFGVSVNEQQSALHVFKGSVKLESSSRQADRRLQQGEAAVVFAHREPRTLAADETHFASLFNFQVKSKAAESRRFDQWRVACKRLEKDPSLLLHFGFGNLPPSGWQIPNLGNPQADVSDATIVGCQWTEGRWPEKRALEFQSINDRVRLVLPGQFDSMTLSAWVCVKGLDRKINSLFMSDGFLSGTLHWMIRRDGVLGLTVIGAEPRNHQIVLSPPVITLEKFGTWLHMAVALDADTKTVIHYVNGVAVSETNLKIAPPFRIDAAELGNWNAKGFPKDDPFMIRNFSGAIDEFHLFNRALGASEIHALYTQGKPQGDVAAR